MTRKLNAGVGSLEAFNYWMVHRSNGSCHKKATTELYDTLEAFVGGAAVASMIILLAVIVGVA